MPIPDQIRNFYLGLLFETPFVEVITAEKCIYHESLTVTNWKFLKFRKIDEIWYNYTRLK
jgi:hypothetical protein